MNCRGNARALGKLRVAVDTCKRVLSTMNVTQCSIDSLHEGIDFNANLSRLASLVHVVKHFYVSGTLKNSLKISSRIMLACDFLRAEYLF